MRQGARGPPQPYRKLTFGTRDICDIVAERSKARGSGPRLARGVGSNPTDVILFSSGFGRGLPFARSLSLSHHRLHPPLFSAVIPTSSPKQPGAPTCSWFPGQFPNSSPRPSLLRCAKSSPTPTPLRCHPKFPPESCSWHPPHRAPAVSGRNPAGGACFFSTKYLSTISIFVPSTSSRGADFSGLILFVPPTSVMRPRSRLLHV